MATRLKVFITTDGLTDYVVATSSRAKALAAWGVHQDVFKGGPAHETDDPTLIAAATAQPGEVLRRTSGTRAALARLKPTTTAKRGGASASQLKKIADLQAKLADLDAGHDKAATAIEQRRSDLDREEEDLHARHETQRAKLDAALNVAQQAPS